MQSAIYAGFVSHHRAGPVAHDFRYSTFMVYLNLNELDIFFDQSSFWSRERFNWASFYRKDYLNPTIPDLHAAVQAEIKCHTGNDFHGEVFLLTHMRYLGYCFNPVSFYYCFEQDELAYIIAEINNTPWNQRFSYVMQCQPNQKKQVFQFEKHFHVSPFLPMNMQYEWHFGVPDETLPVIMRNAQDGKTVFISNLQLQRQEASARNLNRILLHFPATTLKTVAGIYWQALRLKLKGATFHEHPTISEPEATHDGIHRQ